MTVFVDTDAWVALVLADHPRHAEVADEMNRLSAERAGLLTANYVLDETATELRRRGGLVIALRFLVQLDEAQAAGRLRLLWVDQRVHEEAWHLLQANRDLPSPSPTPRVQSSPRANRVAAVFSLDPRFAALGFELLPAGQGS